MLSLSYKFYEFNPVILMLYFKLKKKKNILLLDTHKINMYIIAPFLIILCIIFNLI